MNKHRLYNSVMGSSKYEFNKNQLDEDIEKHNVKQKEQREELEEIVFNLTKKHGYEKTKTLLLDILRGIEAGNIVITTSGIKRL